MTRRERMERVIKWFTEESERRELDRMLTRYGLDILTDDAIDKLAAALVASWRHTQALNRRNRELYAKAQLAERAAS